jgi:hypothetical protein
MPITNSQAIRFSNEEARVIADLLGKFIRCAPKFMQDIVLMFEANTDANTDDEFIIDGSAQDGRVRQTKLHMAQLKYVVEQVYAACTQDDREDTVNRWAVNSLPPF